MIEDILTIVFALIDYGLIMFGLWNAPNWTKF